MTNKLILAIVVAGVSASSFALPRPPVPHGPVVVVPAPVVVGPPVRRHYYHPRPVYRRHYYAPAPVVVVPPRPYVPHHRRHHLP